MTAVNYGRFAYRLTGSYIDSNAIAMGSSDAATTTALGNVEITHGMDTTPYVAFAQLVSPLTLVTGHSQAVTVASGGIGATYITFITTSTLFSANGATVTGSIVGSSVTVNFLWCAMRANQV